MLMRVNHLPSHTFGQSAVETEASKSKKNERAALSKSKAVLRQKRKRSAILSSAHDANSSDPDSDGVVVFHLPSEGRTMGEQQTTSATVHENGPTAVFSPIPDSAPVVVPALESSSSDDLEFVSDDGLAEFDAKVVYHNR